VIKKRATAGGSSSTPTATRSPAASARRPVPPRPRPRLASSKPASSARSAPASTGGAAGRTVADLIEAWFQWWPSVRSISPNTLVNYRRYADQKLLPALGRLPLNRVDTATLDRFYAELRQRGSKCQHCYRRMRDGQPPMRPGEVFRLRFSGEARPPDCCVQGIPMTQAPSATSMRCCRAPSSRPWSGAGSATTQSR
jgi:hypothetical protein